MFKKDVMKVSIIIPVYNVEAYIARCFNSVSTQTYFDIECIFVDDCSPDNCNSLIREMIDTYEGPISFILITHEQNMGLSGARNTGIRAASGEYIFYLDSDDQITPNAILTLITLAKKYPGVNMVQGNMKTVPCPEKSADWRDIAQKKYPEYCSDHIWIKREILKGSSGIPVNACNKLLRLKFILEHKLFFREGIIHEDVHWMFFLAKKINSIAFSEHICFIHYIVEGSIMQTSSRLHSINSYFYIAEDFVKNVDPVLNRTQWWYLRNVMFMSLLRLYVGKNDINLKSKFECLIRYSKKKNIPFLLYMFLLLNKMIT
jgi:glycosyltransferase involved in cell wall biosynthesis